MVGGAFSNPKIQSSIIPFLFPGNGVEPARMERMAFANSFHPEPKTENHTMLPKRFNAILRARRVEPTPLSEPRADHFLVACNNQDECFGWQAGHGFLYTE